MTDPRPCPALRRKPGATEAEPCDRPTGDGWICPGCAKHLERVLAELPSWLGELDMAIARQTRVTSRDGGKPTKRFEQPLPYNETAADLLHQVRNELSTAIRGLCESRGIMAPRIERTPDMATWLVDHVDSIRQDDAAPEMVTWARSLRDAIRWQVDNLGTRFAGPCRAVVRVLVVGGTETPGEDSKAAESISGLPVRVTERECGAALRTRSGDSVIVCRECKTRHDAAEVWARVIHENRNHVGRPVEIVDSLASAGFPVKLATLYKWIERSRSWPTRERHWRERGRTLPPEEFPILAWGEDSEGESLYRIGDVLARVCAMQERRTDDRVSPCA